MHLLPNLCLPRPVFSRLFQSGKMRRCGSASGISAFELLLAAPVLLLTGLGSVQIALAYHAKLVLNYATVEAARTGAVAHAQVAPMQRELAYRLAPISGGDGSRSSMQKAIATSVTESVIPSVLQVDVLNPTAASFSAWGELHPDSGLVEIPNHHLEHQDPDLLRGGQSLHDANLLQIRSTYAYPLRVPLAAPIILAALRRINPEDSVMHAQGRMPITARATVRMQSTARQNAAMAGESAKAPPAGHQDVVTTAPDVTDAGSTSVSSSAEEAGSDTTGAPSDDAMGDETGEKLPLCDEYGLGPLLSGTERDESPATGVATTATAEDRDPHDASCGVDFPGAAGVAGPLTPAFGRCSPAG